MNSRDMLVKLLLDEHLENNGNTEYRKILGQYRQYGMRFGPHGRAMEIEAENSGRKCTTARSAKRSPWSSANPYRTKPVKQYAFHIPPEDWIDLARVPCTDRPGGPLWAWRDRQPVRTAGRGRAITGGRRGVSHKSGFLHLRELRHPRGQARVQARLQKWWTAALDMFDTHFHQRRRST